MSADDFQTKYASVMESMLKSAVAETTKLFETMVDELKAEISKIRKENEDLKARCSEIESAKKQRTVYLQGSESMSGRSGGCEKRDTAVQCDLVPLHTTLVEQCQPHEGVHYALQEHDYDCRAKEYSQMAFILVKQEYALKQEEEDELSVVNMQVLSDKGDSPWTPPCGTENEGPFISTVYSTRRMSSPEIPEETQTAPEPSFLGTSSGFQGAQNQASVQECSLVTSPTAKKDDKVVHTTPNNDQLVVTRHESEVEPLAPAQLSGVPQQCQREDDSSVEEHNHVQPTNEQLVQPTTLNKAEACELSKNGVAENEAVSQPVLPVRRRRGRPPKKTKLPLNETPQSSSSDIPADQEVKRSGPRCLKEVETSSAVDITSSVSPLACPLQPSSTFTQSVQKRAKTSLKDLKNSKDDSSAVSVTSSSERCSSEKEGSQQLSIDVEEGGVQAPSNVVPSAAETQSTPPAGQASSVQHGDCNSTVTLQDAMLLVEAMNQSILDGTANPPENQRAPHVGALKSVDKAPTPSRRCKKVPHKIIVVPRSASSIIPPITSAQSPAQFPKVVAAPNDTKPLGSAVTSLPLQTPSLSPVPQEKTCSKSPPVVPESTTASKDLQLETVLNAHVASIIPKMVLAAVSGKHRSQVFALTVQQDRANTDAPVKLAPSQLMSSTQELSNSVGRQPPQAKEAAMSFQNMENALHKLESSKEIAPVAEEMNGPTEICSDFKMSGELEPTTMSLVVPQTFNQNLSAVVRICRLQFPMSIKESVLVSRLPPHGSFDCRSTLKDGATPAPADTSHTSETSIEERASLSAENCTSFKESPRSMYVQTSTPAKVLQPVFEKAPLSASSTETSAVSCTAIEYTSNLDEVVQDDVICNDRSMVEEESAALISTTSKDSSDPHSQMSKTQFLAQLAVLPVAKDSQLDSLDSVDVSPETSASDKRRLQKRCLMAQLHNHIKAHLQAKRSVTNQEPHTEMVSPKRPQLKGKEKNTNSRPLLLSPKKTASHKRPQLKGKEKNTNNGPLPLSPKRTASPKKPQLKNKERNATSGPMPLSPKKSAASENIPSLNQTTSGPSPIRATRSGPKTKDDVIIPQSKVTESSPVSPRSKSTPVSPRRSCSGRHGIGAKNKTSNSMSPVRSSDTLKNTKSPPQLSRVTSLGREGASPKNTKTGGSPNDKNKTTLTRLKRTSSSRYGASPKKTKPTSESQRASGFSENFATSALRRSCALTKNGSSTKQIKRESSFGWLKLTPNNSSGKIGESYSHKSPRLLIEDATSLKKNSGVPNAKKLTDVAKAKTIAQLKNRDQATLQREFGRGQLAENSAHCETVKKITVRAAAVWIPPKMSSTTLCAREKESVEVPLKREVVSPKRNSTVVFPPSSSLHPIPVKAPPVISPLQPLSVIGRRLLKNQCGECGRVLSSSAALESHVTLHTGRRPFSCTLCGKRFADSKGLKRHGRVHRNGRIHVCPQCGKGFVYRFGLTKHLQMVHSRIKPFVCQICNKGCFTKLDVEAHIRIHTGEKPFHCNLCEKKFTRRVDLNVHLRWHNGEKRHWCQYCGKGFLDFNNLKRHKYIHTGEKPHACPHCSKHFTQSGHLKKHVKNVHKIE